MKGLVFTYALTYGGSCAALFNPFYGLLIYICFAIVRPEFLWYWSVPRGNYSRTIAIALLLGWAMKGFGDWRFYAAKPIVVMLLGYWLCIVLSALFAPNQEVAWNYVELHTKILLPVLVGMTLIRSMAQVRALAWIIALSLGLLAFEGNLDYFQGGNLVLLQGMGGMDNNSFCIAMVLGAGVSFFLGLSETHWWAKLTAFACAALMVHVPMFGESRGAMLALMVLGFVCFLLLPKRPANLAVYGMGILIALRLAGPAVWERFETTFASADTRDTSAQSRLDLWADGWDLMKKHPLTGAGPDHWPLLATQYGWPAGKEMHSLWVNVGAELGFPGLFFFIGMYAVTTFLVVKQLSDRTTNEDMVNFARMTVAGLAGFTVAASFVSLDALEPPYHTILLGASALKVASANQHLAEATDVATASAETLEHPVFTHC